MDARGVQQRRLRHPGIPPRQPVNRRGVDAHRVRHHAARTSAELHDDPQRAVARNTGREDDSDGDGVEYRKANLARCRIGRRSSAIRSTTFRRARARRAESGSSPSWTIAQLPYDQVELSPSARCVGRLFFQVPGGIKYGQHWLNVKFQKTVVRVPFRILTKEEEQTLSKNFKDIRQQVQDAFRPPKT